MPTKLEFFFKFEHAKLEIPYGDSRRKKFKFFQKNESECIPYLKRHLKDVLEAGAEIIIPLKEQDYGGKLYSCKDPERYLWHFGSYNPWDSDS